MSEFKSFLDMPAPAGYVPGLGRGATGFTTRSDLGPARAGIAGDAIKAGSGTDVRKREGEGEDDEDRYRDPENDTGLFSGNVYDPDDREAEEIYDEVDRRMEERRKANREQRERTEQEEFERLNPKISSQFSDLKRALGSVTEDQWANLPEVGDLTRKNKRQRKTMENRYYAVPDSVIASARTQGDLDSSIAAADDSGAGGASDGTMTDFRSISSARDKMLSLKLSQAGTNTGITSMVSSNGDSAEGFTNVDPKGYLTSLAGSAMPSAAKIGDIKRVRPLLESLVKSEPREARGWIGLARLEELAQKIVRARNVIRQGCENCPQNEDVWLESMRLNEKHNARIIATQAASHIPNSINLWLAACDLEDDLSSKKRVLRRALEENPSSDTLWKAAVNLEKDPLDARLLLRRAVELVPLSEDLWLALAHLEKPKEARDILNKARKALKVSRAVWIAAARLEEQSSKDPVRVERIMERGIRELNREGALPERSQWISYAEDCETEGAILTCHAIIKATLGQGLDGEGFDEDDRKSTWLEDGKAALDHKSVETARAIFAYALRIMPKSRTFWMETAKLEKNNGSLESLWEVLGQAVKACPNTEEFWLMFAKEKSDAGDVPGAQEVLARAFEMNPNNEDIWLAAVKLEAEHSNYEMSRKLLERARREAATERVWVKSVTLERQLKNLDGAMDLVLQGLGKFPKAPKLWMQKGQIFVALGNVEEAIQAYISGTRACPQSIPLWLLLSRLEESQGRVVRSRSVLDRAALANPRNDSIWVERVRIELRHNSNTAQARILLARALQECPKSGQLWSEQIWLENPNQGRKTKIVDAVKNCENDPYILVTVARDFWRTGKPKAKSWFERALKANADVGDTWMWYYSYILRTGSPEEAEEVSKRFLTSQPHHGELWPNYYKDVNNFGRPLIEIFKQAVSELPKKFA